MKLMATFAEDQGVELLVIGSGLDSTEHREDHWKSLIQRLRKRYRGLLVYGASSKKLQQPGTNPAYLPSWQTSDLDYIGVDGYLPLSNSPGVCSVEELVQHWKQWTDKMARWSRIYNKKVLLTQMGYPSREDAAMNPQHAHGVLSLEAQTNCYEAAIKTFYQKHDWFAGMFWWYWSSNYQENGPNDTGFTPAKKPAAQVLCIANTHSSAPLEQVVQNN